MRRNVTGESLEIRIAHLEGAYEQVSQRLNGIDQRLAALEQRLDSLRNSMDQKFLWVMGLVLVSILLPLVQRFVPHG
jgi:hypothetical protein